jgi:cell division protein FtsN
MSRDYSRKSARKPQAKAPRSAARTQRGGLSLKWIFSLAAVGGFIGFIIYLNSLPVPDSSRTGVPAKEQTDENTTAPATESSEKKPGFKFYDMLPDSEVVPPQVDEYIPGPGQTNFDYLVQTGSFRTRSDAERQRAEIAFQGLRASVRRIDLETGSIWYRVNVGPFTSRSQMNSAVDRLVSINIEPLVRKVPKATETPSGGN